MLLSMLRSGNQSYLSDISDIYRLCSGTRRNADGSVVAAAGALRLDSFIDAMCDEGYTGAHRRMQRRQQNS